MQDPNRKPRRADGRNNRSLFRRTIFLLVVLGIGIFFPLVAQLYKLVFDREGVDNCTVAAPAADVAVSAGELPRLGTLTVEVTA